MDGSGAVDEEEFMLLCSSVNAAAPAFPGNFQTALEQFDSNDDGLIDFTEFKELNRRYPMVLFPAFKLQDSMWKHTLGERKWAKIFKGVAMLFMVIFGIMLIYWIWTSLTKFLKKFMPF